MPLAATTSRRIRARSFVAAGACLVLGLGLQLVDRTLIVDLLGSMLYVGLFAFLLRACWPALGAALVSAVAFALAAAVELLQLTDVPQRVAEVFPPARLLLGGSFDPIDLIAYGGGAVLAWIAQLVFIDRARVPSFSGDARTET